jgi:hypothetical protein
MNFKKTPLNPAIYSFNATVDFRVRRDTYNRHVKAVAMSKPVSKLERTERDRAGTRRAFATPPPDYVPTADDWEVELSQGVGPAPVALQPPKLIARA